MAKKTTEKKQLTPEQEAAKAEKAVKAKAAKEAKAAKAAEEAATSAIKCSVDECENPATVTAIVGEDKVDSCDEHKEALTEEFELEDDAWSPIEAEKPKEEPKAPKGRTTARAREVEAPLPGRTYGQTRRAQLVKALAMGGVVRLRNGTIVRRVEDLP